MDERSVGRCDVLTAGLPCSGASRNGRARRQLAQAEPHPEVRHLVVAFLAIATHGNPVAIVLNNVEPYQHAASMEIVRSQQCEMHDELHETVLDGVE